MCQLTQKAFDADPTQQPDCWGFLKQTKNKNKQKKRPQTNKHKPPNPLKKPTKQKKPTKPKPETLTTFLPVLAQQVNESLQTCGVFILILKALREDYKREYYISTHYIFLNTSLFFSQTKLETPSNRISIWTETCYEMRRRFSQRKRGMWSVKIHYSTTCKIFVSTSGL